MIWIHYAAVAAICWAVMCRAARMDDLTPAIAKIQHGVFLLLALSSLPVMVSGLGLPSGWDVAGMSLGALGYIVADSRRLSSRHKKARSIS